MKLKLFTFLAFFIHLSISIAQEKADSLLNPGVENSTIELDSNFTTATDSLATDTLSKRDKKRLAKAVKPPRIKLPPDSLPTYIYLWDWNDEL